MRLNPDCIRDILLVVEETTSYSNFMEFYPDNEIETLKPYSSEEILYHIKQCELSGLLTKVTWFMGDGCLIQDLSPKGHEFLANIRSENIWNKTKEKAKSIGSFSLDTLTKIAINIVSAMIKDGF
ncbi:DUF2513 domain-containing protein [Caldifermentibacillus hisashii]|jgi:hypothetical protein|uniref:DUF2513 domain-containing protein n=1 Tax=Caldifermentibacillus hisashii TaxID=996558 RepID=A0ABU9JVL9_9BACI